MPTDIQQVADKLKQQVDEKKFIDVGAKDLPVSQHRINGALVILAKEGYQVHFMKIEQVATGQKALYKVLTGPDVTQKDVFTNRENIVLADFTDK